MDHREPPRIGTGDRPIDGATDNLGARFGMRRFDLAGNRRHIDFGRVGLVALACMLAVALFLYLGIWAERASVAWLAHQPQYQMAFEKIELVNPTPRWFAGGAPRFLEGVRLASSEPENVSMLDGNRDALAAVFRKYAWVDQVDKVTYGYGRIRVDLRYRQPVARVALCGGGELVIDAEATILPAADVDLAALDRVPLVPCDGGLVPPVSLVYGITWKSKRSGDSEEEVDERALAVAKLAGFLQRQSPASDAKKSRALHMTQIIATESDKRGLFLINGEGAAILWGEAPGAERAGRPSADEKWAMLRRWEQTAPARLLAAGDYWSFSKAEVEHVCPGQHSVRHRPSISLQRPAEARDEN